MVDVPFNLERGGVSIPMHIAPPHSTVRYMPYEYKRVPRYVKTYCPPGVCASGPCWTVLRDSNFSDVKSLWTCAPPVTRGAKDVPLLNTQSTSFENFPYGKMSPISTRVVKDIREKEDSVPAAYIWDTLENPGLYKNGLATSVGVNPQLRPTSLSSDFHMYNLARSLTSPTTIVITEGHCWPGQDERQGTMSHVPLASAFSRASPRLPNADKLMQILDVTDDLGVMGSAAPANLDNSMLIRDVTHDSGMMVPSARVIIHTIPVSSSYDTSRSLDTHTSTPVIAVSSPESERRLDGAGTLLIGAESNNGVVEPKACEVNVLADKGNVLRSESEKKDESGSSNKRLRPGEQSVKKVGKENILADIGKALWGKAAKRDDSGSNKRLRSEKSSSSKSGGHDAKIGKALLSKRDGNEIQMKGADGAWETRNGDGESEGRVDDDHTRTSDEDVMKKSRNSELLSIWWPETVRFDNLVLLPSQAETADQGKVNHEHCMNMDGKLMTELADLRTVQTHEGVSVISSVQFPPQAATISKGITDNEQEVKVEGLLGVGVLSSVQLPPSAEIVEKDRAGHEEEMKVEEDVLGNNVHSLSQPIQLPEVNIINTANLPPQAEKFDDVSGEDFETLDSDKDESFEGVENSDLGNITLADVRPQSSEFGGGIKEANGGSCTADLADSFPTMAPEVVCVEGRTTHTTTVYDAATKIQALFRGNSVRRAETLNYLRKIRQVRSQLSDLQNRVSKPADFDNLRLNPNEALKVTEGAMALLFQLDAMQGLDSSARELRKSVAKDIVQFLEQADAALKEPSREDFPNENSSSLLNGSAKSLVEGGVDQEGKMQEELDIRIASEDSPTEFKLSLLSSFAGNLRLHGDDRKVEMQEEPDKTTASECSPSVNNPISLTDSLRIGAEGGPDLGGGQSNGNSEKVDSSMEADKSTDFLQGNSIQPIVSLQLSVENGDAMLTTALESSSPCHYETHEMEGVDVKEVSNDISVIEEDVEMSSGEKELAEHPVQKDENPRLRITKDQQPQDDGDNEGAMRISGVGQNNTDTPSTLEAAPVSGEESATNVDQNNMWSSADNGEVQDEQSDVGSQDASATDQEDVSQTPAGADEVDVFVRSSEPGGEHNEQQVDTDSTEIGDTANTVPQCDQRLLESFMIGEFGGEFREVNVDREIEDQDQTQVNNGSTADMSNHSPVTSKSNGSCRAFGGPDCGRS